MNLKLQYKNLVLVILALLVCFCFNVYAQSSTTIGNDTVVVTIKDENNNSVSLYLPESMNNDQCERRIYGTRTGVIGMFKTLYSEERRTESYEAAIRELCIQPEASQTQSYIDQLEEALHTAGVQTEDAKLVLDMVKHGAESIKKNYVKGGTPISDFRNKLANIGRKLNAAQKNPAFAEACRVFGGITADIKATAQLTDTIAGAFLLNSLSTDQAWIRLKEIERAVDLERKAQGKIDPALEAAIEQSEINLLAAQSGIGAFAVSVNDNLQEITDSAINLGATLAEMSFKFSAPVAMWVAAPLMTYNTLRSVSDQWEMAQDAVSLATVTKMVERHSQGREGITDNITSYGQYAFYSQMEATFSVGGAKFHDFINIFGSANKDLSQYYRQGKQNTIIIAIKNGNSQEETTQENENLTHSEEEIAITSMINNLFAASDNQDWEQMKKDCLPGSQVYLGLEEAQNNTSKPTPGMKTTSQLVIDKINVNNFTAVAYCNVSTIMTFNGKNIRKDDAETTMFLEKVDNKWKLSEVQSKIINTIRGSGSDYIKILSVTPDSGLIDGVDTDFEVVVEYKLVSSKRGGIDVSFNNGKNPDNYYASTRNYICVDKGSGTHIFNVSEKPKNWGSLNDLKVCACLGVRGEKCNYGLGCDYKILNFN
jgi:hypothetical protein